MFVRRAAEYDSVVVLRNLYRPTVTGLYEFILRDSDSSKGFWAIPFRTRRTLPLTSDEEMRDAFAATMRRLGLSERGRI